MDRGGTVKLLSETIVMVFINIVDAAFTAIGVGMGWVIEGNPLMLWIIHRFGVAGLIIFKSLWIMAIVAIFEHVYNHIPQWYKQPRAAKLQQNIRIIIWIGIIIYVLWWSIGSTIICTILPQIGIRM